MKLKECVRIISDTVSKDVSFINYLDTANITNNKVKNIENIVGKYPSRAKKKVQNGDIVFSMVRPNQNHHGIIDQNLDNLVVSTAFSVIRTKENLNNKYLYYFLTKPNLIDYLHNVASNSVTTIPTLSTKVLEGLEIEVPSIETQRKIVDNISVYDDKIENNNSIMNTLEEMVSLLYKRYFVDFEFPNDEGKPYKSNGGQFIDSKLGQIPLGWEVQFIQDKIWFQEGPGIRNWQYVTDGGINFLNIRCISDGKLDLEKANQISVDEATNKYSHFMLQEWDMVVSCSGTLGKKAIVNSNYLPLCLNTSIMRFRPLEEFNFYSYMYSYLSSDKFMHELNSRAGGSVQKNFGPSHLQQIQFIVPNEEVYKAYHEMCFPMLEKIMLCNKENEVLIKTRDLLINELIK